MEGRAQVEVHGTEERIPEPLQAAAAALFAAAADQNLVCKVALAPRAAAKDLAKRRHDVKAALRTLEFAAEALKGGYTFQDDVAAAKIQAIARAVQVLQSEGEALASLLGG